jgi:hypothetical protein
MTKVSNATCSRSLARLSRRTDFCPENQGEIRRTAETDTKCGGCYSRKPHPALFVDGSRTNTATAATFRRRNLRQGSGHPGWLCYSPLANTGLSIVPRTWNGNDSLPSFSVPPANRANRFVTNPCLERISATPW